MKNFSGVGPGEGPINSRPGRELPQRDSGATDMKKTGRPRLDDNPGFKEAFATILPRLIGKEISQGQAARELDISVRSLKRYVMRQEQFGSCQG